MAIVIVPPNNPTIAWAATLDPGHHSFSKWAIEQIGFFLGGGGGGGGHFWAVKKQTNARQISVPLQWHPSAAFCWRPGLPLTAESCHHV